MEQASQPSHRSESSTVAVNQVNPMDLLVRAIVWIMRQFRGGPTGSRRPRGPDFDRLTAATPPGRRTLEGLDVSRFAPLTSEEARDFAQQHAAQVRVSWEPEDRIPSADLPRTQLIDGAMVGLGLISREELAEAHELGEHMDRAHGEARWVREQAELAVTRSREECRALKEQKKKDAAERLRQRAIRIAEQRKTDILFLGRGVSQGLSDRRAHVEKLEALELPILATPADVANAWMLPSPDCGGWPFTVRPAG